MLYGGLYTNASQTSLAKEGIIRGRLHHLRPIATRLSGYDQDMLKPKGKHQP